MRRTDLSGILNLLTGGHLRRLAAGRAVNPELYSLRGGTSFTITGGRVPVRIRAVRGTLWITVEGEFIDRIVVQGEAADVPGAGRIVVTAFEDAQIGICRELPGARSRIPLAAPACP